MVASPFPKVSLLTTDDGSQTLVRNDTGWSYRSRDGAAAESDHVFVGGTALAAVAGPWRVLEFGLGGGMNFARTVAALGPVQRLTYVGIERAPVDPRCFDCHPLGVRTLLREAAQRGDASDGRVSISCLISDFERAPPGTGFDAVYFDPFSPTDEPGSWSVAAFEVASASLGKRARLSTYSAAGWVRRNMAAAGLFVATTPGVGKKREFTIASRRRASLGDARLRCQPAGQDP